MRAADSCVNRCIVVVVCAIAALFLADALPADKARGIAPEDLGYYQGATIWCKDKSKSFALSRLNDDFCDCPDGTDEPGTSACPEGRFYCKNAGHSPQFVFSSRVNDGICDCCDGSDEYNGKATCPNTCWETGKKSREKLEKKVSVHREGSKLRAKDIHNYKHARKQQEGELASLKKEEKGLKDITQKLKVDLDAVEEAERLERENAKEEQEKKAKEDADKNETVAATAPEVVEIAQEADNDLGHQEASENEVTQELKTEPDVPELDKSRTEPEHFETRAEVPSEKTEAESEEVSKSELPDSDSEGTEGLSKEELGRRVASRWTGGSSSESGDRAADEDEPESKPEPEPEPETDADDERDDVYDRLTTKYDDEDDDNYDDNNYGYEGQNDTDTFEKVAEEDSWWQKLRRAPRALLVLLGLKRMHVDASEADRIRSEYRQATSKLNDLQSKISELQNKLKQDFGKEGEFFSLYDQCFERRQQKYVYKVCFYKDSTQQESHASTRLGSWDGFLDNYKSMKFKNGDHCWNGPQRSLKLRLRCGLKSELSDIEEPSRCEYAASFWTPAVCYEEVAKDLQAQLDGLRAGAAVVQGHEEL